VANLPFENALSLVNNKIATEIAPILDWDLLGRKEKYYE
jgi:hypothetical protein